LFIFFLDLLIFSHNAYLLRFRFIDTATFVTLTLAVGRRHNTVLATLSLVSPDIENIVKWDNTVVASLTYMALETIAPAIREVLSNNGPNVAHSCRALSLENTSTYKTGSWNNSAITRICRISAQVTR
jgi:hypothetical protein